MATPAPAATAATLMLSLAVGAGGCAFGPDPDRPALPFPVDTPYAGATRPAADPYEAAGWWRRFGDPTTAGLVAAVTEGNLDLRAAAARVRQSRAVVRQRYGARLPNVSLNATASGRGVSDTGGVDAVPTTGGQVPVGGIPVGGGFGQDDFFETYDLSAGVAWQLDLFGRLRRLNESATLDVISREADRVGLAHTLVAQAVTARVAISTLQLRLGLAEANVASLRETLATVDARYAAGVGDPVDLRLARENVATAEAQVPPLRSQLLTQRFALAVLAGVRPDALSELPETLPPLPELPPPPVGVPAALLDRRPDLIASEFQARARQAEIGASVAELFPDVSINLSGGLTSDEVGDLFDADSFVYSVIGSAAQPIFAGGQIRGRIAQARAAADEAAATYAGDVLTAIREVNDAMVREEQGRLEVEAAARALLEAESAEELARERYQRGVGNLLTIFEAERRRRSAEERLALARQGVWDARVDLHLALGGDWDLPLPAATTDEGES